MKEPLNYRALAEDIGGWLLLPTPTLDYRKLFDLKTCKPGRYKARCKAWVKKIHKRVLDIRRENNAKVTEEFRQGIIKLRSIDEVYNKFGWRAGVECLKNVNNNIRFDDDGRAKL